MYSMVISIIVDINNKCYFVNFLDTVPYNVSELFSDCYRKVDIEQTKPTDDYFSTSMCVSASKYGIAADLDKVANLFDSYQHDEETIGQAIIEFINILNRADLNARYTLFKEQYMRECEKAKEQLEIPTKPNIIATVVKKKNIDPINSSQEWAVMSVIE